jgi:hypothetical protein
MGNDVDQVQVTRNALLWMLRAALLEIRAAETLNAAVKISDIFHVLPIALSRCASGEELEAQFSALVERARRHGMDSYVLALREAADRQAQSSGPGLSS